MVWAGTPTPLTLVQAPTGFALGEDSRETFLRLGLNPQLRQPGRKAQRRLGPAVGDSQHIPYQQLGGRLSAAIWVGKP